MVREINTWTEAGFIIEANFNICWSEGCKKLFAKLKTNQLRFFFLHHIDGAVVDVA